MRVNFLKNILIRHCHLQKIARKMSSEHRKHSVAVCQITSTNDKEGNFEHCSKLIKRAAKLNAKVVFLPEGCDYIGTSSRESLALAETLDGATVTKYKELAKTNQIWISLGGVHIKSPSEKVFNTHVMINDVGEIAGLYRKVHLFDVEIPEKNVYLKESKYVDKGMEIAPPINSPVGKIGLGICYDLRFPAFSQKLVKMGAEILTYPSAFTTTTGKDHWEILLRGRAIESQCYVVAAAQVGSHFEKRSSYGHSMIVDPWGKIVAECVNDEDDFIMAELDMNKMDNIRRNMPVDSHKREDLYNSPISLINEPSSPSHYQFGSINIKNTMIFFKTELTMAFVNKKCVLPGHVLVAPIRIAKRLSDLTEEEAVDFFGVVRRVQQGMEKVHKTSSSTVTIQDGEYAGQTVFHLHAHIIPRQKNDLDENDKIYSRLENHEKDPNIMIRSEEVMEQEAAQLQEHFKC